MTKENKLIYKDGMHDISNYNYHLAAGYSRSQLFLLEKTPYHFWYNVLRENNDSKEQTPSMIIGSIFHTMLLEPHKFNDEYILCPKIDRRTAKGKEEYQEFLIHSENKTIVTEEQIKQVNLMLDAVNSNNVVKDLLKNTLCEQSIFWTDKDTGIQFKTRPDAWQGKMVVDIKTTSTDNIKSFQYSAIDYGYYLQAAMICNAFESIGHDINVFINIACQKTAPYLPIIYFLDAKCIEYGKVQFNRLKLLLKHCLDTNEWPGYPIQELSIPSNLII